MTTEKRKRVRSSDDISGFDYGFGLVEAMIAAAVLTIVALGISTLVQDMMMVQKKSNVVGVINTLRGKIISAVQNGESWQINVNNTGTGANPEMACLRDGTPNCVVASITGDLNLVDIDAARTPIYLGGTAGHGFTMDGQVCTTYPSDPCPFRYVLKWVPTCPGAAANCKNPNIQVTGVFEHTPGSFVLPGGFNPALYAIDIRRGAEAIRNDRVSVRYVTNGTTGEGACHTAPSPGWTPRLLNTVVDDVGDNVVNKSGSALTGNVLTLKAGTYNCRIQAPAFKSGGNRLRVVSTSGTTVSVESSSATASLSGGGTANLVIETTLILNAQTSLQVEQTCTNAPTDFPGTPATQALWGMGVPLSSDGYATVVYTTVVCARTS